MATAKQHDGRSIVAYVKGKAVDSEGKIIEGAPPEPENTDPSEQPHALAGLSPEQRMGVAIAKAVADPKGTLKEAKAIEEAARPATPPAPASEAPTATEERGGKKRAAKAAKRSKSRAKSE